MTPESGKISLIGTGKNGPALMEDAEKFLRMKNFPFALDKKIFLEKQKKFFDAPRITLSLTGSLKTASPDPPYHNYKKLSGPARKSERKPR